MRSAINREDCVDFSFTQPKSRYLSDTGILTTPRTYPAGTPKGECAYLRAPLR
ncbi:hypothetical protein NSP_12080 [Nodularia spumigena CCY9414]|nr:hypothetical protein NSP_12080 [Nodularia spumigena CCY9414]